MRNVFRPQRDPEILFCDACDLGTLDPAPGEEAFLINKEHVDATVDGCRRKLRSEALVRDREVRADPEFPSLGVSGIGERLIIRQEHNVAKLCDPGQKAIGNGG